MRAITALLGPLLISVAAPVLGQGLPRTLVQADVEAWLDGFLPHALAREDIAGAAVVVVRDGKIIVQRGYGHADTAAGAAVDPASTVFRTGSVGKLFTWTAVMQLEETGRLDLDRDVNDYLDFRIPPRAGKPVTLRNLMTHTPGFEEVAKRLVTDRPDNLPTLGQYLKAWIPERIFPPGEVPAYSNYGASLAGYIVERVSGQSYDDYVQKHVFEPLGMEHSTTRQPLPEHLRARMSRGYALGSGPAQPFEHFAVGPAGGASTTAADMGRFMIAYLQRGQLGGARILRPDTVNRIFDTRHPVVPALNSMLLGFFEENLAGRRIAGHRGDTQFFHGTLSLFLDEGVGVYLVINSTGRSDASVTLPASFMSEFVDRYYPALPVQGGVDAETAAEHARQMVGTYESSRRQDSNFFGLLGFLTQVQVTLDEDGGLLIPRMLAVNGQPMKWREVQPFLWHQVGGKERVAARAADGRVKFFSFDFVSPFMVMHPVPWWKSTAIWIPIVVVAFAVILAAILAWPIGALLRRRLGPEPAHAGLNRAAYRSVRLAGLAVLAAVAGWTGLVSQISANLFAFSPELDPWIALLKVWTLVGCVGAAALALWDAWLGWYRRGWISRVGSALLVLSYAALIWIAAVLKLAGFATNY